ncbi:MAG: LysM peptidoglycan-binding domain-containing protein [Acetatifactor sp.]
MDLPKNIVQIGEIDKTCKVYIEDFCFSYLKQLNVQASSKHIAVALYGNSREEEGISYLFVYCACRVLFLEKDTKYLPQAALQDIEKQRKRYFVEYSFLGYHILDGEMMEGIHAFDHGTCRYVGGYARFYEKNEKMLQYMLSEKKGEAPSEEVSVEKYEAVRKRQEERKRQVEAFQRQKEKRKETAVHRNPVPGKNAGMRFAGTAAVLALGVGGAFFAGNSGQLQGLFQTAKQTLANISERQLPEVVPVAGNAVQVDKIVAEDKLTQAILEENRSEEPDSTSLQNGEETMTQEAEGTSAQPQTTSEELQIIPSETMPSEEVLPASASVEVVSTQESRQPTKYTIKRGDTLLDICQTWYGDESRLEEICSMNHITDPNDIKAGQKILLP